MELEDEVSKLAAVNNALVLKSFGQYGVGGFGFSNLFPDNFTQVAIKSGSYTWSANECIKSIKLKLIFATDTDYDVTLMIYKNGSHSTGKSISKNYLNTITFEVGYQYFISTSGSGQVYVQPIFD